MNVPAIPAPGTRQQPTAPPRQGIGELVVWGAHGGAGTTTLAVWLRPAWDAGAMRPETDPRSPARLAVGRPLVVATRNTAWSAAQATRAVATITRQGGQVTVLAVISDGWPEPTTATHRFALLQPHLAALVHVPFIPGLRLAADPAQVPLPRRALRALARIQAATGRAPSTT